MTTDQKLLADSKEAAGLLSVGKSTFLKYVKDKKVPQPVKIGGAVRWRVSDLQAFVADPTSLTTTS